MYIHIYICLLTYNLPAFTVTREKTPPAEFRDNNILNHCLGKKEKFFGEKNKEKANFVTPVEKNQEICNPLVKRTKTHRKMLQFYYYK